ncbi:MAG: hypothetical protein Q9181_003902 [Wetmoreana brouardii]
MVEPVGATLGAIGLLFPVYQACERLHRGYKLTKAFGHEWQIIQLQLDMHYSRLELTSTTNVANLKKLTNPGDIYNKDHPTTSIILRTLSTIQKQFETAHKLKEYYHEKEKKYESIAEESCANGSSDSESLAPVRETGQSSPAISSPPAEQSGQKAVEQKKLSKTGRFLNRLRGRRSKTISPAPSGTSSQTAVIFPSATDLLNTDMVQAVAHQDEQAAQQHMKHTSFKRKVKWARKKRDIMFEILNILEISNTYLEKILVCKEPQDATRLTVLPDEDATWLVEARKDQLALKRLHESLRNMNTHNGKRDPWYLSLEIRTNFDQTRQDVLNTLYEWDLNESAYYFTFQRQGKIDGEASYFISETSADPTEQKPRRIGKPQDKLSAWYLDRASDFSNSGPLEGYEQWGSVWTASRKEDQHWLFHAKGQKSLCKKTLASYLANIGTDGKMTAYTRAQLALLVAITYMRVKLIRLSCDEIETTSFKYYQAAGTAEENLAWDDNDPLILRPFLCFGFGRKLPVKIGARTNSSYYQDSYVVSLGLLLYQIGTCSYMGSPSGNNARRDAQKEAINDLHQLDLKVGGKFAEIVQNCLQYPSAMTGPSQVAEDRFIEGIVSELFKLQNDLYN